MLLDKIKHPGWSDQEGVCVCVCVCVWTGRVTGMLPYDIQNKVSANRNQSVRTERMKCANQGQESGTNLVSTLPGFHGKE